MSLSTFQIRKKQPSNKRTTESVQEGSGCFLITEPSPLNSKRFILRMRYPFNKDGRLVDIPLGSWGKEINSVQEVIRLSETVKRWSKVNNLNPKEYKNRFQKKIVEKTISDVFESYMDIHKQKVKKVTWGDTTGLKIKLDDKAARKSFAARHKCDQQKDKTTASYWACNIPRYAKQLGLSGGGNFFW